MEIEASIGKFELKDTGMRSSIRKLATEVRRCPQAKFYRIIWVSPTPEGGQSLYRAAIFYDRERKRLAYEDDVYSGSTGKTYTIDDTAIQAVAEEGGSLEDFAKYDRKPESSQ